MEHLLPYSTFILAIALGWWLGRRGSAGQALSQTEPPVYYPGLSVLLGDQPGSELDHVIEAIPVGEDTLDTYLSLAKLMRSKGDFEAATRIHQHLLAWHELPEKSRQKAHLELVKDYIAAGLHDRAEAMLRDMISDNSCAEALTLLQQIYQAEKDWEKAAAVARKRLRTLSGNGSAEEAEQIGRALSHYYCAMAEEAVRQGSTADIDDWLHKALELDAASLRAAMLIARRYIIEQPDYSLDVLLRLSKAQPAFTMEVLPLLAEVFDALPASFDRIGILRDLAEHTQSSAAEIALAEKLAVHDTDAAKVVLREAISRRSTLRLLIAALKLESTQASLQPLIDMLATLRDERPAYHCRHCGFSGRKLHWLCPSCEQWGTIAPIRSTQGD